MGTITAKALLQKARLVLQDERGVRWSAHELLGWLNDGQREAVMLKPNVFSRVATLALQPGTRQELPPDCLQLIDVVRNMGAGQGNVPGRAISQVMREVLDAQYPAWHAAPSALVVRHYVYSPMAPGHFFVYPPQPAAGAERQHVEVVYARTPPDISSENDAIVLDDVYQSVLLDYVLYRAYSKDAEHAADHNRAEYHRHAFVAALTGKATAELAANPARHLTPKAD